MGMPNAPQPTGFFLVGGIKPPWANTHAREQACKHPLKRAGGRTTNLATAETVYEEKRWKLGPNDKRGNKHVSTPQTPPRA